MIIYIDMDDVLCDYSHAHAKALMQNPSLRFPQSQHGFFENLVPIEGGLETVKYLKKSNKYAPYILTAPSEHNPFSYTEKRIWIEKHLGFDFVERLIICSNKSLLKGDILIDDHISGKVQENFEGQLIHFGSEEFMNWVMVQKALE
jgi:5'-nucleotidase